MSNPLVAVVGRPNVGKSTLFNRIVGRRIAIVEDTPGVTRDRLYAPVRWKGRTFTVIDTGGIILNESDPLKVQVRNQAEIAMDEADAILFVCDAADSLTATDQELANALRGSNAPVFLVVNKADNTRQMQESVEFYELGMGQVYSVSAVHGHGMADLFDDLLDLLSQTPGSFKQHAKRCPTTICPPQFGKHPRSEYLLGRARL